MQKICTRINGTWLYATLADFKSVLVCEITIDLIGHKLVAILLANSSKLHDV